MQDYVRRKARRRYYWLLGVGNEIIVNLLVAIVMQLVVTQFISCGTVFSLGIFLRRPRLELNYYRGWKLTDN